MHYFLLVMGVPLLGYGLLLFVRQVAFLCCSRKVSGRLVTWKEAGTHSRAYWYPQVCYTAHDGSQHLVTGATGTSQRPKGELGSSWPVRYDSRAPERACISTFSHLWGAPLGFLILGVGVLFAFSQHVR